MKIIGIQDLILNLKETDLVVNSSVGAILIECPDFKRLQNINNIITIGKMYYIGSIQNKNIFVDPSFTIEDNVLVNKNDLNKVLINFDTIKVELE